MNKNFFRSVFFVTLFISTLLFVLPYLYASDKNLQTCSFVEERYKQFLAKPLYKNEQSFIGTLAELLRQKSAECISEIYENRKNKREN